MLYGARNRQIITRVISRPRISSAQVALTGARSGFPSDMSFMISVICNAQSIRSRLASRCSADANDDVDGVTFREEMFFVTLTVFAPCFLRKLGI